MSHDICGIARWAYDRGQDAITYAEQSVAIVIDANLTVRAHRLDNPGAFPAYGPDASIPSLARRILGELLDAGWTPPHLDDKGSPAMTTPPEPDDDADQLQPAVRWPMIGPPTEESR